MPFSAKTLDFLMENRIMNSRTWYQEHKKEFEKFVKIPMAELVDALAPTMLKIDSELETVPRVGRTMSRVFRDTRFTKDKSLYRDHMWIYFGKNKALFPEYPSFFVDISPDGLSYGCGWWYTPPKIMEQLRNLVLTGHPAFQEAQTAFLNQKLYALVGDCYKRPRYTERTPEEMVWLCRKNISFVHDSKDFKKLFSETLAKTLKKDLAALAPMYRFLCLAASLKNCD